MKNLDLLFSFFLSTSLFSNEISQNEIYQTPEAKILYEYKWFAGVEDCFALGPKFQPIEILELNSTTYILRQNKCINFEAPFMYLLFGKERALLLDTGATRNLDSFPLRTVVDELITKFESKNNLKLSLIVAHSHAHGDHVSADIQFRDRPNTTLVSANLSAVISFFNFVHWPSQLSKIDLGERSLDIIPIPGHEQSSIALYDSFTQDMYTGDTFYPGNIFLNPFYWKTFVSSIERMVKFNEDNQIRYFLGAHIEMSKEAKVDYPYGSTYHPNEHRLPLLPSDLRLMYEKIKDLKENNETLLFDDFRIAM